MPEAVCAMTARARGVARPRKRAKKADSGEAIGHVLPTMARAAADKVRMAKTRLTRSEALASAPWSTEFPSGWERAFRAAYADRLEERGIALPAKKSSGKTGTPGGETNLMRRAIQQTEEEFAAQDATAKTQGLSWSTWARRKLTT